MCAKIKPIANDAKKARSNQLCEDTMRSRNADHQDAGIAANGKAEHEAKIRQLLRRGDTITHTRCMGCVEEHIFTHYGRHWLCGSPTRDTIRLGGPKYDADDIAFVNVTHINRVPVDVCEFAAEFQDRIAQPDQF